MSVKDPQLAELQSWWEVPAIAHFCHVFKSAFNLFHFEIEELEDALLQNNAENSVSIDQLVIRLLQSCYEDKVITTENWEDEMWEFLREEMPEGHSFNGLFDLDVPFFFLPLRSKVQMLFLLCELRLNREDVAQKIKKLDHECMRIEPVGKDSQQNCYWYFFGLRLYKEDTSVKNNVEKSDKRQNDKKKNDKKKKKCDKPKTSVLPEERLSNWSVVCYRMEDWESLIKQLRKTRKAADKNLSDKIEQYRPQLLDVLNEQARLMRKREMEMAPRRSSARISEVRRQREEEEAITEQLRQKKLEEERHRLIMEEKQKKEQEIKERAKRAAERHKAVEDRAKRAKLRELRLSSSDREKRAKFRELKYSSISARESKCNGTKFKSKSVVFNGNGFSRSIDTSSVSESESSSENEENMEYDDATSGNGDQKSNCTDFSEDENSPQDELCSDRESESNVEDISEDEEDKSHSESELSDDTGNKFINTRCTRSQATYSDNSLNIVPKKSQLKRVRR